MSKSNEVCILIHQYSQSSRVINVLNTFYSTEPKFTVYIKTGIEILGIVEATLFTPYVMTLPYDVLFKQISDHLKSGGTFP